MASLFSHTLAAFSIGKTKRENKLKFFLVCIFCACVPDADVIMFRWVTYEHPFGHRGFFHSLFFCFLLSHLLTFLLYRQKALKEKLKYMLIFFLCGASHGFLDMLTNGGLGVAIFAPFNNERYFFPFRPIQVSPLGIGNFFGEWGLKVLISELIWIGIPCAAFLIILKLIRK